MSYFPTIFIIIFILITFHSHTQSQQIAKRSFERPTNCYNCYQQLDYISNPDTSAEVCSSLSWRTVNCPAGSSCFTKIARNSSVITVHKSCVQNDLQNVRCSPETNEDEVLLCEVCHSNFCNTRYAIHQEANKARSDYGVQRKVLVFSQIGIFVLTAFMLRDVF